MDIQPHYVYLGWSWEDKVTGFQGVAVGFAAYLSGCAQVLLSPKVKDDGTQIDPQWFDVQRLEKLGNDRVVLNNGETPGHDKAAPKR